MHTIILHARTEAIIRVAAAFKIIAQIRTGFTSSLWQRYHVMFSHWKRLQTIFNHNIIFRYKHLFIN